MSDRELALAALSRWHAARPWARVVVDADAVAEVSAVGPSQVILESIYEARGVRYRLEPAPTRPQLREDGPDPWSVRLEHPPELPVGNELTTPISGTTVHMDCGLCSGMGELSCPPCSGTGRIQRGRSSYTCTRCHGRGEVQCEQCVGSGGLYGHPSIWSRLELHEEVKLLESSELPLQMFLDLQDADHGGEVVHQQQADRIVDLRRDGAYRDAPTQGGDSLRQAVQQLGAEPGVPRGGQVHRQQLEVRRVAAFEVLFRDGRSVWVYGDPPNVSPKGALDSPALKAARLAPWALALAIVVGVISLALSS